MIKLATKYLKPFRWGLLLALLLLLGQAVCDLFLPNIMSDIVNIGVMQGGIESSAPMAVSEKGMTLMTTFMTEDEKRLVADSYETVTKAGKDAKGKTYGDIYPNADGSFFILKDVDKDTESAISDAFGNAGGTFVTVLTDMAEQQRAQAEAAGQPLDEGSGSSLENAMSSATLDLNPVYEAILPALTRIPPQVIGAAREKTQEGPDMLRSQVGVRLAKAFLDELGYNTGGLQTASILKYGLIMLLVAILGGLATIMVSYISTRVSTGAARDLRKDVFTKVTAFSNAEFDKYPPATLITRSTNDISQMQMLLMMGVRIICYAPIMAIGGFFMALNKAVSMSWIIALAIIALLCVILVVMQVAMPKFKIMQKLVDKLNLVSREGLSGMLVIRAFGTQDHEAKRFDAANVDLTKTSLFVNRVMVTMMPVMMLLMNAVTLLTIWVGANRISNSAIQVGDMMAFMQYAIQVIFSFLMIAMIFIFVPRASVAADRVAEVLDAEISIVDPEKPKKLLAAKKGVVEFKNVSFRYHGATEDALTDISFTAEPGKTTAIIGATGAGKTTIANLLMRFYDVSGGEVIVDGVDTREAAQRDLRDKIGYVPQKGVLLSGTIESNLRYGNHNVTDAELEKIAEVSQALGFIHEKEEGFNAGIAQGGTNVSGGQKQRLSIARALAKNPEILVFDDSFSALDFKTDAALRKALKEHTADATVILVAQRVGTIMHAEQILVLDKGRIVGRGTHRELLKACPEYVEIAQSQLSKEELA